MKTARLNLLFRTLYVLPLCLSLATSSCVEITPPDRGESSATDLSFSSSANCYIVSEAGYYKFRTVKGNSGASVGAVTSAEVLWETFGTAVTPVVGDLVNSVSFGGGYITFKTADTFKEGNAVIAAKDASGNILWSWHIWLTDQPEGQVYYNNAGTMMDRNLGATSATPGDVGTLGLLYQWGRKDPFIGSSSISLYSKEAASTAMWPSPVESNSSNGTIEYATSHPTTFIISNESNSEWYYTGDETTDNERWTPSDKIKSIYDPCPAGWRVPDGGENGVWARACWLSILTDIPFDEINMGVDCAGKFGDDSPIWYPAASLRSSSLNGMFFGEGSGLYWSASAADGKRVHRFGFGLYSATVSPVSNSIRGGACSVRCVREGSSSPHPYEIPQELNMAAATDLSSAESANCYVVSESGLYKFKTVKGNSNESVGSVASASILWETFGTSVRPECCDLINGVCYKDGCIAFKTANTFKEGNAVIAAKDADGKILWSWHIWLTDQPQGQVYYNNAGTMMDRNLGATSATPGDVGALGLLYQWGRKDPFLGSSSISDNIEAKSTIVWPSTVSSDSSNGTIAYATANPTTFIKYNSNNYDWYYTGDSSTDNTRWTTSSSDKSIYDPCPAGWRVPDGGENGVWSRALGSSEYFVDSSLYDSFNKGTNVSGEFGSTSTIWYPCSGKRDNGNLHFVGVIGRCWSSSPCNINDFRVHMLAVADNGRINPAFPFNRQDGYSVRCLQE